MARSQNTERIHLCLDEQSYKILLAKAAYQNKSMNAYLIDLASNVIMAPVTIKVHDLNEMLTELDKLTYKASGYYNLVVSRGENIPVLKAEDASKMATLFANLSAYLESFYNELIQKQETAMAVESEYLEQIIAVSEKSCKMKSNVQSMPISTYDVELVMTPEKKEIMLKNIEKSRTGQTEDLSGYFKKLILSKYYLDLFMETNDLEAMTEYIYSAKRYGRAFISLLSRQDISDTQIEQSNSILEESYRKVLCYQKEIWNTVENDRKTLYYEYMKKIRIDYKSSVRNLSRVNRSGRAVWLLQESSPIMAVGAP